MKTYLARRKIAVKAISLVVCAAFMFTNTVLAAPQNAYSKACLAPQSEGQRDGFKEIIGEVRGVVTDRKVAQKQPLAAVPGSINETISAEEVDALPVFKNLEKMMVSDDSVYEKDIIGKIKTIAENYPDLGKRLTGRALLCFNWFKRGLPYSNVFYGDYITSENPQIYLEKLLNVNPEELKTMLNTHFNAGDKNLTDMVILLVRGFNKEVIDELEKLAKDLRDACSEEVLQLNSPENFHMSISTRKRVFIDEILERKDIVKTKNDLLESLKGIEEGEASFTGELELTNNGVIIMRITDGDFTKKILEVRSRLDLDGRFKDWFKPDIVHMSIGRIKSDKYTPEQIIKIKEVINKYNKEGIFGKNLKMTINNFRFGQFDMTAENEHNVFDLKLAEPKSYEQKIIEFLAQRDELPDEPVDLMLVLGNSRIETVEKAVELYNQKKAKMICISGGASKVIGPDNETKLLRKNIMESDYKIDNAEGKSEAEIFKEIMMAKGVPSDVIIIENQSTNSKENILNAKKILEDNNIPHDTVIILQHPVFQRRAKATVDRWFGEKTRSYSYAPFIPQLKTMNEEERDLFIKKALAEFDKFDEYGPNGKGDIAQVKIPPDISDAYLRLSGYGVIFTQIENIINEYAKSDKNAKDNDGDHPVLKKLVPLIRNHHALLDKSKGEELMRIMTAVADKDEDVLKLFEWMLENTPSSYLDIADSWPIGIKTEMKDGAWGKLYFQLKGQGVNTNPINKKEIDRISHIKDMIGGGQDMIRGKYDDLYKSVYQRLGLEDDPRTHPDLTPGLFEEKLKGYSDKKINPIFIEPFYLSLVLHDYGRLLKNKVKISPEIDRPDANQHRISGIYLADDLLEKLGVRTFDREVVKLMIRQHDAFWCLYCLNKYNDYNNFTYPENLLTDIDNTVNKLHEINKKLSKREIRDNLLKLLALVSIADVYSSGDRYLSDSYIKYITRFVDIVSSVDTDPVKELEALIVNTKKIFDEIDNDESLTEEEKIKAKEFWMRNINSAKIGLLKILDMGVPSLNEVQRAYKLLELQA
ncbi:MAG: YdcF family protein [Candidatus Ancaeobacter aquaticus]|nr:YdcF family protein [Candidatus Ancaeobacter aquaticus]